MRRGAIVPGLILILVGAWFLASNLGMRLPGWGEMWPIFPLVGGLLFLGGYLFDRHDPGLVFVGMAAALVGVFFFVFTFHLPLPLPGMQGGVTWDDMARLWPVFVMIGGIAFVALFLADPRHDWGVLSFGVLALIAGVVAIAFTLGLLSGPLGRQLAQLWPLVLIVLGLVALIQAAFGRGRPRS